MKNLMIMSTHSGVGKNIIVSGLLRILQRKGMAVSPFKGCNIEPFCCLLENGRRIAFAQAIQCKAARLSPSVHHSPVIGVFANPLGSENGECCQALFVLGKKMDISIDRGNCWQESNGDCVDAIKSAIDFLSARYECLVIEGAGSPVELGLENIDLPNRLVSDHANANIVLMTEMLYGGGHAHLVGTLGLMDENTRARVKGLILNKFPTRQPRKTAATGIRALESATGLPVIGVIPYLETRWIPDESIFQNIPHDRLNGNDRAFDQLADELARHIDVQAVIDILGKE